MGTGNFYKVNLDKYYTIDGSYDEQLTDTNDNIFYDLQSQIKLKTYSDYSISKTTKRSNYSLQSFERYSFAVIDFTYKNRQVELYLNYNLGYYQGASYDIDIIVEGNDYRIDDGDIRELVNSQKFDKILKLIEKVYQRYSTKLNRVATFSNGETIYEKSK